MGKSARNSNNSVSKRDHMCTCILCRRKLWMKVQDDVDLDVLLGDMHNSHCFLFDDRSHQCDESLDLAETCSTTCPLSCPSLSTKNTADGDNTAMLRQRTSEPMLIQGSRTCRGDCRVPKSLSLPLRAEDLPDPFPELTNSPMTPTSSLSEIGRNSSSARSSPSSPHDCQDKKNPKHRQFNFPSSESLSDASSDSQETIASDYTSPKQSDDVKMWHPTGYVKTMLHFYNYDDNNSHVISITEKMNAREVCNHLIAKYCAHDDASWSITEQIPKLSLERNLEDHEIVYHIYRSWGNTEDNKFLFKKDFRKYELFKNPIQFFPPHMIDSRSVKEVTPDILCTGAELYKQTLLRMLTQLDSTPEVQGHMLLKEGKKSWKKYFCILRKSGLYYSSKGSSKDPRHLVLVTHLTDVNIYTSNVGKKIFGTPNNYCICLKPPYCVSDLRDLILLCAEDEQSRLCWTTGMRLVKYGSQLLENYRAPSSDGDLHRVENTDTTLVPMDFTASGGRVIDNPFEAQSVSLVEAYNWRKTAILQRKPITPPMSQSPNTVVVVSENPNYHPHLAASFIHVTQPWYHSCISREEAVSLIGRRGAVDGVFLVRESNTVAGAYVLSLAHNYKIKHCQIGQVELDGSLFYSLDAGQTKFADLIQLVEFYQLNAGGLPTKLTHYVSKL